MADATKGEVVEVVKVDEEVIGDSSAPKEKAPDDGVIVTEADMSPVEPPPPAKEEEKTEKKEEEKIPAPEVKPKSKYQLRIDELVRDGHDKQREIERLQKQIPEKPVPLSRPNEKDFESVEDFDKADREYQDKALDAKLDARDEKRLDERIVTAESDAKKSQEAVMKVFSDQVTEVAKERPDGFKEKVESMSETKMPQIAVDFIMGSDHGADMAAYFADNPQYAESLLKSHPIEVVNSLNKLQQSIVGKIIPKKTLSNAPEPITPGGGGSSDGFEGDPDKWSNEKWLEHREKTKKIL